MRGQPLMPCSPAKARHLLKAGKAVVKRRTPFTIQLRIATGETKQNVTLGVDAGAKHVGLSATTEKEEVFASEVELRQDITGLLAARLSLRRDRRHRKTRYLAPRFLNPSACRQPGGSFCCTTHLSTVRVDLLRYCASSTLVIQILALLLSVPSSHIVPLVRAVRPTS